VISIWLGALLCGLLLSLRCNPAFISLMRQIVLRSVSIVWVLTWCLLPLLLSAYVVLHDHIPILYLLCFLRVMLFSFMMSALITAFGSASWILQPLAQFSDWVGLVLFCRCSTHWPTLDKARIPKELGICILLSTAAAILDRYAVSALLRMLLN
jgi:hypothetical protein